MRIVFFLSLPILLSVAAQAQSPLSPQQTQSRSKASVTVSAECDPTSPSYMQKLQSLSPQDAQKFSDYCSGQVNGAQSAANPSIQPAARAASPPSTNYSPPPRPAPDVQPDGRGGAAVDPSGRPCVTLSNYKSEMAYGLTIFKRYEITATNNCAAKVAFKLVRNSGTLEFMGEMHLEGGAHYDATCADDYPGQENCHGYHGVIDEHFDN